MFPLILTRLTVLNRHYNRVSTRGDSRGADLLRARPVAEACPHVQRDHPAKCLKLGGWRGL